MSPDRKQPLKVTRTIQLEAYQDSGLYKMASIQKTSVFAQLRRAIDEYLLSQGYLKTLDK